MLRKIGLLKMEKILLAAIMFASLNLIGQINQDTLVGVKLKRYSEKDTIPIVVNLKDAEKKVLYYLNGQMIDEQELNAINFMQIGEMKVEKEANEVDYEGIIYITTKDNYHPKLISLNELKAKYLNLPDDRSTLFLLDEKVANGDYDEFKVDEKFILKIEVQNVENTKEGLNIRVVKLITRTKENLKKANTIRLKGNSLIE